VNRHRLRITVIALVLISSWHLVNAQAPRIKQEIKTPSLCELTRDWKRYDHTTVRIAAIYRVGQELSDIYDASCPDSESTAWADLPSETEKTTPRDVLDHLNQLIRSDGRARLVVRGEFDGPKKVNIPPNTPKGVAELMREVNSRYGHQNRWRFRFVISKIENVQPVALAEPWPRWTSEKKQ
jgi:hypothetical protein